MFLITHWRKDSKMHRKLVKRSTVRWKGLPRTKWAKQNGEQWSWRLTLRDERPWKQLHFGLVKISQALPCALTERYVRQLWSLGSDVREHTPSFRRRSWKRRCGLLSYRCKGQQRVFAYKFPQPKNDAANSDIWKRLPRLRPISFRLTWNTPSQCLSDTLRT